MGTLTPQTCPGLCLGESRRPLLAIFGHPDTPVPSGGEEKPVFVASSSWSAFPPGQCLHLRRVAGRELQGREGRPGVCTQRTLGPSGESRPAVCHAPGGFSCSWTSPSCLHTVGSEVLQVSASGWVVWGEAGFAGRCSRCSPGAFGGYMGLGKVDALPGSSGGPFGLPVEEVRSGDLQDMLLPSPSVVISLMSLQRRHTHTRTHTQPLRTQSRCCSCWGCDPESRLAAGCPG